MPKPIQMDPNGQFLFRKSSKQFSFSAPFRGREVGLGSCFSALRQPSEAPVDVLEATLRAGLAASDADANARGELCVIHALACTLAAARQVAFPVATRVLLPVVLRHWAESDAVAVGSVAVVAEAMLGPATSAVEALCLARRSRSSPARLGDVGKELSYNRSMSLSMYII